MRNLKDKSFLPTNHIFDLDRTFFKKNVSFAFYFYLLRQGGVSYRTFPRVLQIFIRYSLGFLPLKELHSEIFSHVLKGLRLEELQASADLFLTFCENRVCPLMHRALCEAQKAGLATFLLSSSPDFLVSRIAKKFSFDRYAGTGYSVDKEGRLCEILLLITGPEKKEIANRWVEDASSAVAYSDSFDDLSLLEWAGLPIAVRPDRKLKEHALRFKWGIL